MENGKYTKKPINFQKLLLKKFTPCLYNVTEYSRAGCGANAISVLTGEYPYKVVEENKHRNNYSDTFILKKLKKHGISAKKLTKCDLTNKSLDSDNSFAVSDNHLLLVCQLMRKNEATWSVYWNGLCFHNFELTRADFWTLMNFPIISAYCLHSAKWA